MDSGDFLTGLTFSRGLTLYLPPASACEVIELKSRLSVFPCFCQLVRAEPFYVQTSNLVQICTTTKSRPGLTGKVVGQRSRSLTKKKNYFL